MYDNILTNHNTIDSHLYFFNTGKYFVMWCGSYMYITYLNDKKSNNFEFIWTKFNQK